ncbi:hypothetical protein KAR91_23745 [Candidatus Pacearchaeota archaeon]|nr:hypothetical protein [Candidatus Pacearchaeota archaeon]
MEKIEYLTMSEAFECGDDDIPYIEGGFNRTGYSKKQLLENPNGLRPAVLDHFSNIWRVKKADPKVLTVDQAWEKYRNMCFKGFSDIDSIPNAYTTGFADGKSEGRLERDLELRPVFKALSDWESGKDRDGRVLLQIFQNLKPLKPA